MRRLFIVLAAILVTVGAASFATAQDSTPIATACASPVAGTPIVGSPVAASPEATPTGCGLATEFTVNLVDIAFKPDAFSLPAGVPVTLIIQNTGLALHNFSIDALDIGVDLGPGGSEIVVVTIPAGDYEYYCAIPGHLQAGMKGTLHVQ